MQCKECYKNIICVNDCQDLNKFFFPLFFIQDLLDFTRQVQFSWHTAFSVPYTHFLPAISWPVRKVGQLKHLKKQILYAGNKASNAKRADKIFNFSIFICQKFKKFVFVASKLFGNIKFRCRNSSKFSRSRHLNSY